MILLLVVLLIIVVEESIEGIFWARSIFSPPDNKKAFIEHFLFPFDSLFIGIDVLTILYAMIRIQRAKVFQEVRSLSTNKRLMTMHLIIMLPIILSTVIEAIAPFNETIFIENFISSVMDLFMAYIIYRENKAIFRLKKRKQVPLLNASLPIDGDETSSNISEETLERFNSFVE